MLGSILGGIHQQNVNQESMKESKADDALKQQEGAQQLQMNQLAMKQTNQQLDQNAFTMQGNIKSGAAADLKSLSQQLLQNPSKAKDPAFIAKYNQLSTAAGQLPITNKDGSIDVDSMKPSYATSTIASDPKQMAIFMQLPLETRESVLNGMSGVPKEMHNQKTYVTFKDQTARDRVTDLHADTAQKNSILAHYDAVREKYIDTETGLVLPAQAARYRAGVSLDAARSSAIVTTANAALQRATTYTQRVADMRAQFTKTPNGSMSAVRSLLSSSSSQLRGIRVSLEDANKNLINAQLNSTDPSVIAEAQTSVDNLQKAVDDATEADNGLRRSVESNPQVSSFLGASSGKPTENVGSSGGSKTVYSTSGGKPIVSKDGGKTWKYQ